MSPPLAGVLRRWAALVYEALLVTALVFIASFLLSPLVSPGSAARGELVMPSPLARVGSFLALFTLGGVFFAWIWSEGRRTLPMKAWRLTLVAVDGKSPSRRRALARYLAAWIGPGLAVIAYALLSPHGLAALAWPLVFVNWLAALVDPQRQFLHDRIAGTRILVTPR